MANTDANNTRKNEAGTATSTSSEEEQGKSAITKEELLEKARTYSSKEKRQSISEKDTQIGENLQAGNGLQKFLADTEILESWCDTMLGDQNIQNAITNNLDTVNTQEKEGSTSNLDTDKSEEIKKALDHIAGQLYKELGMIQKRTLTQDRITKILKTLFVHDAIQNIRDKKLDQKPTAEEVAEAEASPLKAAWYDFNNVLNPIVFRRYRMNADNLKAITSQLKMPDSLSDDRGLAKKLFEKLNPEKPEGSKKPPGIIENFFNEEKAAQQCSIDGKFISEPSESTKTTASGQESVVSGNNSEPVSNPSELKPLNEQTVLNQLNEAPVIALFKTTVEEGWIAKYVEEKLHTDSNPIEQGTREKKTWATMFKEKGITMLQGAENVASLIKSATGTQQYGNDWKETLIKKIKENKNLSSKEIGAQIAALIRIMDSAPNTSLIGSKKFYTVDELTSKQIQALENAQTYLSQQLDALDTKLNENHIEACSSIIESMVSVAEKIDQTTQAMGENMYQNYCAWQTLFPNDSSSTEASEINKEIEKFLTELESIKSQRTYNGCLETLKTLKSTITADPTAKQAVQAKVLAAALSKQITQAEKKGPLQKLLDWLKQLFSPTQKLTAETLLEAGPRTRLSREGTHKESKIVEDLETISKQLDSTQSHALNLKQSTEPKTTANPSSVDLQEDKTSPPSLPKT